MRVDDIVFEYQLSEFKLSNETTNEKVSTITTDDSSSATSKVPIDVTSDLSPRTTIIDRTSNVKNENVGTMVGTSSSTNDSTKPTSNSPMSFVDLVETIFIPKEDIRSIENTEQQPTSTREESKDISTVPEEIPRLSTDHESKSDTPNNNTSKANITMLD